MTVNSKFISYLPYFPMIGLAVYVIVFIYAASLYPGGSLYHADATEYSYFHNLLCDAMDKVTQTGKVNDGRFMAVVSHLILSFTMIAFFLVLPGVFDWKNRNIKMIRYFGVLSMAVFAFMFTDYHDLVVTITGIIGTIAMIPFFIELRRLPDLGFKTISFLCFGLSIIVFLMFETKIGFYYLPLIQKIAFVVDAIWVYWVCIMVIKKDRIVHQVVEQV